MHCTVWWKFCEYKYGIFNMLSLLFDTFGAVSCTQVMYCWGQHYNNAIFCEEFLGRDFWVVFMMYCRSGWNQLFALDTVQASNFDLKTWWLMEKFQWKVGEPQLIICRPNWDTENVIVGAFFKIFVLFWEFSKKNRKSFEIFWIH